MRLAALDWIKAPPSSQVTITLAASLSTWSSIVSVTDKRQFKTCWEEEFFIINQIKY